VAWIEKQRNTVETKICGHDHESKGEGKSEKAVTVLEDDQRVFG